MNSLTNILGAIDDFVWGPVMLILLVGTGVFLTVRLNFLPWRNLGYALKSVLSKEARTKKRGEGDISPFSALMTALAATIGTGNIVGVATAIVAGGPGALFWMVVAAFLGMATKYAEGLLAVKYRVVDETGHSLGGPFYYIEKGMGDKWKWLAKMFAIFGVGAGLLGIGTFTQINGITGAVKNFFDPDSLNTVSLFGNEYSWAVVISGVILTLCTALAL